MGGPTPSWLYLGTLDQLDKFFPVYITLNDEIYSISRNEFSVDVFFKIVNQVLGEDVETICHRHLPDVKFRKDDEYALALIFLHSLPDYLDLMEC
ncbi:hypothetical protein Ddc_14015 [Ditylenchus destructor]|nr:hypothetical protein Ddc_14015 [Ditylenchus destructor]